MTEANARIAVRETVIGFGERSCARCAKLAEGDLATFYLTRLDQDEQSQKIQAFSRILRIAGPMFESNDVVWPPRRSEIFPWRRRIEVLVSKGRAPIRPFIGKLELITSDVYWALPLKSAAREISKHDFDLIRAGIEASASIERVS